MTTASVETLFDFDSSMIDSPDFKEDSVREEIILPILKSLGYTASGENKIVRSKAVSHPFVQVGANKRKLTNFPDYLLQVANENAWVLDAKAPNEEIKTGANVEQTYFYAIHPEINVRFFALCNGREFIVFDRSQNNAVLYFSISEYAKHREALANLLSVTAFSKSLIPPPRNCLIIKGLSLSPK